MPIHIKGSGGSQKLPSISVNSSGLVTATAGNKIATKQLDSSMDADFVAGNIKSGVNIFGKTGTFNGYERVPGIAAAGKTKITIPCTHKPKAVLLIGIVINTDSLDDYHFGITLFGHFPEYGYMIDQDCYYRDESYGEIRTVALTSKYFTETYKVEYSDNSVTVGLVPTTHCFLATFDAIVFG